MVFNFMIGSSFSFVIMPHELSIGKFENVLSQETHPLVRMLIYSQGGTDEDVLEAGGPVKAITSDCLTAIDCRSSS